MLSYRIPIGTGLPSSPAALPILHLLSPCWKSSVKEGDVGESGGRALSSSSTAAEWSVVSNLE